MKRACPCLACAAALALALLVAVVAPPTPARAGPNPLRDPRERDLTSPYAHTAIGAVIDANGGKIPASGQQLVAALAELGDFVQLPVTFSAVALDSGLTHPRVVLTMRPASHPVPRQKAVSGWGGMGFITVTPPAEPLNTIAARHTQLEARLFLAANMELDRHGTARVRTIEFISWNSRKLQFDFGVIEGLGGRPELTILDGVRCVSCHKNRGPILGVAPWTNTVHNSLVRTTMTDVLRVPSAQPRFVADGMNLFTHHADAVDAAVRQGGDLPHNRAVFKHLAGTAEGREALALLLGAVAAPGTLSANDECTEGRLNAMQLQPFLRDAHATRRSVAPGTLRDFNLTVPVTRELSPRETNFVVNAIRQYDSTRAAGIAALPPSYVPSNPRAFTRTAPKAPKQPTDVVSATLLAQTIGLSDPDREFLGHVLDQTVDRLDNRTFGHTKVTELIVTGPAFADVLATGNLPDRDDFKDRFLAGAAALLKSQKRDDHFEFDRDDFASAPKIDPNAKAEVEAPVVPSHACLACHDVRTPGKSTFNPIPQLHFDPFDATARGEWVKNTDRKRRAEVLGRMLKRLGTDKDMPPEDSVEHELFRMKDPAALTAVLKWLEAELKRAK